jgi:hypothetical protein
MWKGEDKVEELNKTENFMATDLINALQHQHIIISPEAILSILIDLGTTTLSNASTGARKVSADIKKILTWLKSHLLQVCISAADGTGYVNSLHVEDIGATATSTRIQ